MKKPSLKGYLLHVVLVATQLLELLSNRMFSDLCFSTREGTQCERSGEENAESFLISFQ